MTQNPIGHKIGHMQICEPAHPFSLLFFKD